MLIGLHHFLFLAEDHLFSLKLLFLDHLFLFFFVLGAVRVHLIAYHLSLLEILDNLKANQGNFAELCPLLFRQTSQPYPCNLVDLLQDTFVKEKILQMEVSLDQPLAQGKRNLEVVNTVFFKVGEAECDDLDHLIGNA